MQITACSCSSWAQAHCSSWANRLWRSSWANRVLLFVGRNYPPAHFFYIILQPKKFRSQKALICTARVRCASGPFILLRICQLRLRDDVHVRSCVFPVCFFPSFSCSFFIYFFFKVEFYSHLFFLSLPVASILGFLPQSCSKILIF